jgi:hypothetical protein
MGGQYNWLIGVALAAVASVISNLGLNLQKLTHLRRAHLPPPERALFFKDRTWQLGLSLIIGGSVADFVALGFGQQSIIAPLGSLTLVANMFFAPYLLGERIDRRDVLCTVLIVCGAATCVFFASHEDEEFTPEQLFSFFKTGRYAVFAAVTLASLIVLMSKIVDAERLHARYGDTSPYLKVRGAHRFAYAAIAGVIGAQSVLFAKCTAELLVSAFSGTGTFFLFYFETYLVLASLGATIFLQLRWLNHGLQLFDALYVVPVFQVCAFHVTTRARVVVRPFVLCAHVRAVVACAHVTAVYPSS